MIHLKLRMLICLMKSLPYKVKKKIEKVKILKNEHNCILEKNKSLTIEIKRLRRDLASKNENFHPKIKVLNEIIRVSPLQIKEA